MNKKIFYENYKFLLELTGIKQKHLLEQLGISSANIWRWKQGTVPQTEMLMKIITFFEKKGIKFTLDEILNESLENKFRTARELPINPTETAPEHGTLPVETSPDSGNRTDSRKQSIKEVFDLIMKITEEHRTSTEKQTLSYETKIAIKWFEDHLDKNDGHDVGDPCWKEFVERLKERADK